MKTNLRGKIREFLASEKGKTGLKAPLTLGIATGSVLLAQVIMAPTPALACTADADCAPHRCDLIECTEPDGAGEVTCWGVCRDD